MAAVGEGIPEDVAGSCTRSLSSYLKAVRPFLLSQTDESALFLNHAGRRMQPAFPESRRGLDTSGVEARRWARARSRGMSKAGYHTFRRVVHRSAEAAGLDINVTPHTFRRSCTTELIRGGANLYHVKELLGHENLDTLKHYTKLTIEDLKATHARCHPRERN